MHRLLQQGSLQLRNGAPRAYASSLTLRSSAPFSTSIRALAHSDYGSGDPQPGKNPSEDQEHPGPPPPDTGSSSTSSTGQGRPALHHEEKDGQVSQNDAAVKQHNEEMDKRQAKSHDKDGVNDPKDKVEKGYCMIL